MNSPARQRRNAHQTRKKLPSELQRLVDPLMKTLTEAEPGYFVVALPTGEAISDMIPGGFDRAAVIGWRENGKGMRIPVTAHNVISADRTTVLLHPDGSVTHPHYGAWRDLAELERNVRLHYQHLSEVRVEARRRGIIQRRDTKALWALMDEMKGTDKADKRTGTLLGFVVMKDTILRNGNPGNRTNALAKFAL